jgi:hypothetical protein
MHWRDPSAGEGKSLRAKECEANKKCSLQRCFDSDACGASVTDCRIYCFFVVLSFVLVNVKATDRACGPPEVMKTPRSSGHFPWSPRPFLCDPPLLAEASRERNDKACALCNIEGSNRRVPQVSLLRPGIPQTNSHWKHPPSPLSSRAEPRDLQFCGPFVEMFFDRATCPGVQWKRSGGTRNSTQTPTHDSFDRDDKAIFGCDPSALLLMEGNCRSLGSAPGRPGQVVSTLRKTGGDFLGDRLRGSSLKSETWGTLRVVTDAAGWAGSGSTRTVA